MRRRFLIVLFALSLLTVGSGSHVGRSLAQGAPDILIRLASQSAWNSPSRPLSVAIRATNASDQPLRDLSVVLSIQAPARSRSVYELSLRADATSLLSASFFPQGGRLDPGATRTFRLRQRLGSLAIRQEDAIYPLKLQVLSGDRPVAELRTPMVFLNARPRFPLRLGWTWVLSSPLQYRPDGTFLSGTLEGDVAPGGRLSIVARALARLRGVPVDLAMSPLLADQLAKMAAGYRIVEPDGTTRVVRRGTSGAAAAARVLALLSRIARRQPTELVALPFGDAVLPAMLRAGLGDDVPTLMTRGRSLVQSLLKAPPRKDVFRPPFSLLDDAAAARLNSLGVSTVLLDPSAIHASPALKFSPEAVVNVPSGPATMHAIVPDPQVLSVARTYAGDPALAAHAAMGELAATWLEFPGLPNRAAAVVFPEREQLDPNFVRVLSRLVGDSPWLKPTASGELPSIVQDPDTTTLAHSSHDRVSPAYRVRLSQVGASLDQFEQTARGAEPLTTRLRDLLLIGTTAATIGEATLGQQFVDSVDAAIRRTYAGITVSEGLVTLTSREGFIPVTLRNTSGVPLRLHVRLVSDLSVAFVNGNSRFITLPPSEETLTFAVRAKTTGRFPVRVQVRTPGPGSSAETITQSEVVVRSTAYNRLALFLTIGAGLFLLGWWGRRFIPRGRS